MNAFYQLTIPDSIKSLLKVEAMHRKAMQAEIDRLKERVRELEGSRATATPTLEWPECTCSGPRSNPENCPVCAGKEEEKNNEQTQPS